METIALAAVGITLFLLAASWNEKLLRKLLETDRLVSFELAASQATTEEEVERLVVAVSKFQENSKVESLSHRIRLLGNRLIVKKAHLEIARITGKPYESNDE